MKIAIKQIKNNSTKWLPLQNIKSPGIYQCKNEDDDVYFLISSEPVFCSGYWYNVIKLMKDKDDNLTTVVMLGWEWQNELFRKANVRISIDNFAQNKCKKHPTYKAIRKPTADCAKCREMWKNR
jgi:hypothetical protein